MAGLTQKRNAYIIGQKYGMFPFDKCKFETTDIDDTEAFSFFANRSNRTQLLIKFDKTTIDKTP